MNIIKPSLCVFLVPLLGLIACGGDDSGSNPVTPESSSSAIEVSSSSVALSSAAIAVDYSPAIRMNTLLGKGINFGNSWDAGRSNADVNTVYDYLDDYWSNPIQDEWFTVVKTAGFNSIRLPVRWNQTAENVAPYTLQAARVAGVKEDIRIANSLGMPVIINVHHYLELYADPTGQEAKFFGIWRQIAEEFKDFSNDSLVFEILNESRDASDDYLNVFIDSVYHIIRATNPDRTIMVNPGNWGKFEEMEKLVLPSDGNMIISGHYYDPFGFTHQGHDGRECGILWDSTNQTALTTMVSDFKSYIALAKKLFPGINGTHIPLNVGEFGVSSLCSEVPDANRGSYLKNILEVAEGLGFSWHYWAFTGANFDAYNKAANAWYPEILEALIPASN